MTDELDDLEAAFIDVCQMGLTGDAAGVRLAARRLIRKPPSSSSHPDALREAIGSALAAATVARPSLLRRASADDLPIDTETSFSLAALDQVDQPRPVLPAAVEQPINDILTERSRLDALSAAGLAPTKTLLLTGPPGVGKTITARYVATELGVPLLTIDLASVMSSYLGRTGQNLRSAMKYGREHQCVVFIDEFDALAKRRDDDSDIGELKRLVNVLLLELERWPADNLLIAATNHPELLDRAISRRFDVMVDIPLPDPDSRQKLVAELLVRHHQPLPQPAIRVIASLTDGMSGSDIVRLVANATRRSVLDERPVLEALITMLGDRADGRRSQRDELCRLASRDLGWSQRHIAQVLGVSHPTVGAALRRGGGNGGS